MKAAEIETLKFSTMDKMVTHDWGAAFDQCADEKDKLWHCLNTLVKRLQAGHDVVGRLELGEAVLCLNATRVDDI
jgi:hypothetical protein